MQNATILNGYAALLGAARARGLAVTLTLFRRAMPRWAHQMGGWRSAAVVEHFVAFVADAAALLDADVHSYITFNDPAAFAAATHCLHAWPSAAPDASPDAAPDAAPTLPPSPPPSPPSAPPSSAPQRARQLAGCLLTKEGAGHQALRGMADAHRRAVGALRHAAFYRRCVRSYGCTPPVVGVAILAEAHMPLLRVPPSVEALWPVSLLFVDEVRRRRRPCCPPHLARHGGGRSVPRGACAVHHR